MDSTTSKAVAERVAEWKGHTVGALSYAAECGFPQGDGRDFVVGVRDALVCAVEDLVIEREPSITDPEDGDWTGALRELLDDYAGGLAEIADNAVPVYTARIWSTFSDVAAWQEDVSDLGQPDSLTQGATWALYGIAYRLASALAEELRADLDGIED